MHNLKIKIYEEARLLEELTKIQKEIFIKLNLECPYPEERGNSLQKKSFLGELKSSLARGCGRPKGSKNKKKSRAQVPFPSGSAEVKSHSRRGRPKGSKNKEKSRVQAPFPSVGSEVKSQSMRGRPKGSKNKIKPEKQNNQSQDGSALRPSRRPGRPIGSKNRVKP